MKRREDLPAAVWVVGGAPGSGKSTVADLLVRDLVPVPAVLDKDVLFAGFVDEVRRAHGRDEGEREGEWYDAHVKRHEYDAMAAAGRQIRAAGCPVVLVAPYTAAGHDASAWAALVAAVGGEPVRLVWVRSDGAALQERIRDRGRAGDTGKLARFDSFLERIRPDEVPPVPHLLIDNRSGTSIGALRAQVRLVIAEVLDPRPDPSDQRSDRRSD